MILLFNCAAFASSKIQPETKPKITLQAQQSQLFGPDSFEFKIEKTKYIISNSGQGIRYDEKKEETKFSLPTDEHNSIEAIGYSYVDEALIIIYQISGADVLTGYIVRLNKNTLKLEWITSISGFNIGPALLSENAIYLTAIGFIGKLDLLAGRYSWQYKNLNIKTTDIFNSSEKPVGIFNSFETPVLKNNIVYFTEHLFHPFLGPPVTIEVDDMTGKIIKPLFIYERLNIH